MARYLSPFRFGIVFVMALIIPLSLNAKTTRLRDIFGPESLLSLDEAQALVEKAEDAFYRAEYAVAFDAVQRALKLTEEKLGDTNRDVVNILILQGEGQTLLGDYVEADKSLSRARQIGEAVLGENHPVIGRGFMDLSGARLGLGNPAEAADFSKRGAQILGNYYGTNSVAFSDDSTED